MRTRAGLLKGGKSGAAIVLGRPAETRILQRVRAGEMPPREKLVEACVKPLGPTEIDILDAWIAGGAREEALAPDVAGVGPDSIVTDRDRDFWSFRPPRPPTLPFAASAARAARFDQNPIDLFLNEKLAERGLCMANAADRLTLLRRVSFDLTGLPPAPEAAQEFLADLRPDAYEHLVDRLLASPRYGEHWGRLWLDLAGYADSEGKREQDLFRPHAWRYRDYVIRAFNDDKPFDRFLLEQIAGDELAPYEPDPGGAQREITPDIYDNLVATGFLRMVPDATWANITGFVQDRVEVIADEIDVLGSAVLGLTMKCARCHDHKLEPIPQRDYFRLLDVFKGALDEHDWLKPEIKPGIGPVSADRAPPRHLPYVTTAERRAWEAENVAIAAAVAALQGMPPGADRDQRVRALEAARRPEPRIHALWDRGDPSPTYIYLRGDPTRRGPLVGPGVPAVLADAAAPFSPSPPWPNARKTGRRLAFARWLTRPDHPLTARVLVNRIWRRHFGRGIVASVENFGRSGARPTHPELLDWLAIRFVASGWSTKAIQRLIVTSAAYRQGSSVTPERERLDPSNALYSRMPMRRLGAEEVHDALLSVAERLDHADLGPPERLDSRADGLVTSAARSGAWRRGVYARQERKLRPTLLEDFGLPTFNPNCTARSSANTATQALHLLNNAWVHELAAAFAERVARSGSGPAQQVESAYWIAFARAPNADEITAGVSDLHALTAAWSQKDPGTAPDQNALVAYCHALLNSAEFIYVD